MNMEQYKVLQGLCRLCLTTLDYSGSSGRTTSNCLLSPKLCILFGSFTSFDVSQESSDFPKYICPTCLTKLHEYDEFRKKAVQNTHRLYEIWEGIKNGSPFMNKSQAAENVSISQSEKDVNQPISNAGTNKNDAKGQMQPHLIRPEPSTSHIKNGSNEPQVDVYAILPELLNITPDIKYESGECVLNPYYGEDIKPGSLEMQTFICPVCKKTFNKKIALDDHISVFHLGLNPTPFQCPSCKKSFRNHSELSQHQERCPNKSGNKDPCPYCSQLFSNKYGVMRHIKVVHRGEKRFACSYCPKRFGTRIAQRGHERRHSSERPYICNLCCKGFAKKPELDEHRDSHTILKEVEHVKLELK